MTTAAADAFREILARGPVPPATAIAAMEALGHTARQTRRAREALGVRPGKGPRSVWTLDPLCPLCHQLLPHVQTYEERGRAPGAMPVAPSGNFAEIDERETVEEGAALGTTETPVRRARWTANIGTTCSRCGRTAMLPAGSSCIYLGANGRPCRGVMA